MKSFYDYCESVKKKTDLTEFILQIKATPKDSLVYLVLADYLEEQNNKLETSLGQFLRGAITKNSIIQKKQRSEQDNNQLYQLNDILPELRIAAENELKKAGYRTINHEILMPKKQSKNQFSYNDTPFYINNRKMAITIPQLANDGDLKPNQRNNVAIHDMDDRMQQLNFIFGLAQDIYWNDVNLDQKYKCDSSSPGLSIYSLYIANLITPELLIPMISDSYQCCDVFDMDHIKQDLESIKDLSQRTDGDHVEPQASKILARWATALEILIEKGCEAYRPLAAKIVRDFRLRNSQQNHD